MSAVPAGIDTEQGPPMALPLRHFLVGLGFLLLGAAVGVADAAGLGGALGLAHLHLLLIGWVCVTIMGALTQFVPVWSGRPLHSRRLARVQLVLVAGGLAGFALVLARGAFDLLPLFGEAMLLGFWTCVYNVARTLPAPRELDVTERHFALALACFAVVPLLGYALAVGFAHPLSWLPVARGDLVAAHATLAVFGIVLTTILGALYQLATMFTQTELDGIDRPLQRVEEVGYPAGVLLLAGGRLVASRALARAGAALLFAGLLAFAAILTRRLVAARVDWTPMLSRYAVVAAAIPAWILLAAPAWLRDPLARDALLGGPGARHLLVVGVVGFVVLGTLYHVVPFLVWVARYSDRVGFEPVPSIDDLYDDRLATADLLAVGAGTVALVAAGLFALPPAVTLAGGVVSLAGFGAFCYNVHATLREHGRRSALTILLGGGPPAIRSGDRSR